MIFSVDNSLSIHTDHCKNSFLVLRKGSTDDINYSIGTAEKIICMKVICMWIKTRSATLRHLIHTLVSILFMKGMETFYKRWNKWNLLDGTAYDFSVDHNTIKKEDILNIYNYLTKKHNVKKYLNLLFIHLFIVLFGFGGSLATKSVSLYNHPYIPRPILINLTLKELCQGLSYHWFMVSLKKCDWSFNIVDDLSAFQIKQKK